tara:strand:+ start:2136 stop:2570 length:435 start_codon:yes stop_codon:yes gene_type:complete
MTQRRRKLSCREQNFAVAAFYEMEKAGQFTEKCGMEKLAKKFKACLRKKNIPELENVLKVKTFNATWMRRFLHNLPESASLIEKYTDPRGNFARRGRPKLDTLRADVQFLFQALEAQSDLITELQNAISDMQPTVIVDMGDTEQ